MKTLLVTPRMSEKAYAVSKDGTYVFNASLSANKQEIAAAVAKQYNVQVTEVNVVVAKGKNMRTYRGRGKFANGTRRDTKKAYVRLKEGDTITIFEEAK